MEIFLAISIGFFGLVFILTRKTSVFLKAIFAVLWTGIFLGIMRLFFPEIFLGYLGDEELWYNKAPWLQILLWAGTVAGGQSNALIDFLKKRRKLRKSEIKPGFFRWEDFAIPFLCSIGAFFFFWKINEIETFNFDAFIISYQNGFFWPLLVGKLRA